MLSGLSFANLLCNTVLQLYFVLFLQDLPTSIKKICCLILLVFGQLDLVLI